MAKNDRTSEIIDGVLKIVSIGGFVSIALVTPRMVEVLDKPMAALWKRLDKRDREREIRRVTRYMKARGLIKGDYDHGIKITDKGRERLSDTDIGDIQIQKPGRWDGKWRIVFYDIPEKHKHGRNMLAAKLKQLNFYSLQRSVMVHPYPCRDEIAAICDFYGIEKYVSYIETGHIDQQDELKNKLNILLRHKI